MDRTTGLQAKGSVQLELGLPLPQRHAAQNDNGARMTSRFVTSPAMRKFRRVKLDNVNPSARPREVGMTLADLAAYCGPGEGAYD